MKRNVLGTAITCALLGLSTASFAQSVSQERGSPRCNALTGVDRDQCQRDEDTRTQGSAGRAASDSDSRDSKRYADTGSARCDALNGRAKDQCILDEAARSGSSTGSSAPDIARPMPAR